MLLQLLLHLLHVLAGELLHHLLHGVVLLEEPVDVHHVDAGAARDALLAAGVEQRGVVPLGGRHGEDDGLHAADGPHVAEVLSAHGPTKTVRLQMKDVSSYEHHDSLSGVSCPSDGYFLDTGTRHFVRVVKGLDTYDVTGEGREIRYNASELQPVGANVNFIEPTDGGVLKVRTYEKGVEDETYACGTGIVASCIAAYKAGIRPSGSRGHHVEYDVRAKRDSLKVSFRPLDVLCGVAEEVYLTGPATFVAEVTVTL